MAGDSGSATLFPATEKSPRSCGPSVVAWWGDSSSGRTVGCSPRQSRVIGGLISEHEVGLFLLKLSLKLFLWYFFSSGIL